MPTPPPHPALNPPPPPEPASSNEEPTSAEPEWIDVSPDTPRPTAPEISAASPGEPQEAASQARWHTRWNWFLMVLAFVAAILATRWVTWRQAVMYQPPLEVSALSTPSAPTPGERALAGAPRTSANASASAPTPRPTVAPRKILVHVIGLVKKPGVFEIQDGARLKDALHLAGGVLPNADLEAINLAEPLEDGRQYRVTQRQPASASDAPEPSRAHAERAPQVLARATPRPQAERTGASQPGPRRTSAKAPPAPIDLNRADLAQLEQLPGVGPATAQGILDYRNEIGGFKSVDDLDGVKGIGPKKLDKIRPYALVR